MAQANRSNPIFQELERTIGIQFKNKALLREALTHRSFMNESKGERIQNYERLEFLGDAVLEYVVRRYLFRMHQDFGEGRMTNLKSALVKGENLAKLGEELNLARFVRMSKGQCLDFAVGSSSRLRIVADVVESLLGAVCIDRGIGVAELFVLEFILPKLREIIRNRAYLDPKSELQDQSQARFHVTPSYKVELEQGTEHDRVYVMSVWLDEKQLAIGKGGTKQEAEIGAARIALKKGFGIDLNY